MKTFKDLNLAGVYNVFDMKGSNNNLVICYLKDKVIYCVKNGRFVLIPTEFSDASMQAFIKEMYDYVSILFKLSKASLTSVKDVEFKDDFEVVKMHNIPSGVAPVGLKYLEDFFNSKDIDISKLKAEVKSSDISRDYSELLECSAEARDIFESNKKALGDKVMESKYESVASSIKRGDFVLLFMVGPAGTGKTTLAYQFAQYCGAPLITFQGSEGVTYDNLIGCSDVKTDYGESSDSMSLETVHTASSFTVIEGELLKAYREGYQIVIDEANYLVPGVMSVINSMTDDTPTYPFKGKRVKRHPNFVLYLTSNPGYEGTYLYNTATKSRGLTLVIDKLSEQEFTRRMYSRHPELSIEFYKSLYKLEGIVQEYADKWGESSAICIRHADALAKLVTVKPQTYEEFKFSFTLAYLNNGLCMDNDNTTKLKALLDNEVFVTNIKDLYSLYNFRILPDIEPTISFEDIFSSVDTTWAEDTKFEPDSTSEIDAKSFADDFNEEDFK